MIAIIKFAIPYLRKYKFSFALYLLIGFISSFIVISIPYISGSFVDVLIGEVKLKAIMNYGLWLLAINIAQIVLSYINMLLKTYLSAHMSMNLNTDLLQKLQRTNISYIEKNDLVYLNQRIYSDSNELISFVLNIVVDSVVNFISLVITFILLFNMNKITCLIIIISIIIYFLQYKFTYKFVYKSMYTVKESQAQFYSLLQEQLTRIRIMKIYNLYTLFKEKLKTSFIDVYKAVNKSQKILFIYQGSETLVSSLSKISLYVSGGIEIMNGNLSVGMFSTLSSYFSYIQTNIKYFIGVGQQYASCKICYDRMMEITKQETENEGNMILDEIHSITLKDLTFQYDEKHRIIENLNYRFQKGKIYCIYGSNGSGKSTVIDIILGLYVNKTKEAVYYNDYSISKINLTVAREQYFSYTCQKPLFFNDTILHNITLSSAMDTKEINSYCEKFSLFKNDNSAISLDTILSDNAENISGGELQKIGIIRELLRQKEVMIFDEPTNSLDQQSKKFLFEKLQQIKTDKIIILVTHDEALKNIADEILYVK